MANDAAKLEGSNIKARYQKQNQRYSTSSIVKTNSMLCNDKKLT